MCYKEIIFVFYLFLTHSLFGYFPLHLLHPNTFQSAVHFSNSSICERTSYTSVLRPSLVFLLPFFFLFNLLLPSIKNHIHQIISGTITSNFKHSLISILSLSFHLPFKPSISQLSRSPGNARGSYTLGRWRA